MTLDVRGSLKNTKLSSNPYVVFEELISNSIDSFLIRKHHDSSVGDLRIHIEVNFEKTDLLGDEESVSISCTDNGIGLGDEQVEAFLTKDTSYKDDLQIAGIGACKGAGRVQFFHHFRKISIESVFQDGSIRKQRKLQYSEPQKIISHSDLTTTDAAEANIYTQITLQDSKSNAQNRVLGDKKPSSYYIADTLKHTLLLSFIQKLVNAKDQIGEFEITFESSHYSLGKKSAALRQSDLPEVKSVAHIEINERSPHSGDELQTTKVFVVSHYELQADQYPDIRNSISLCAKSTPVLNITPKYLKTRADQKGEINGAFHIILIEGEYLDVMVNEQRDDFENIPEDIPAGNLFITGTISYLDIYDAIGPTIYGMVAPTDWNKEEVIRDIVDDFGVSEAMIQNTSTRITHGDTPQAVVSRVLKKYQEQIVDETAEIQRLKDEIVQSEPDTEDFREKINTLSWKYTSSLKTIDMVNLSQLIVRRSAIVEILALACGKNLAVQNTGDDARRKDERLIHSVFFPMGRDSSNVKDHDIWLLSEEYCYYNYIASDIALSSIKWDGGEAVFEDDIDERMAAILEKRADDNHRKRPDIALFHEEGSAIIIEFKSPGVELDDHTGDLNEYAHLLAAKSKGRIKRFYCYLIGDAVNPLRLASGWQQLPSGSGWFSADTLRDPETGISRGAAHFEILFYDHVIRRAQERIGVYKEKLNVDLS